MFESGCDLDIMTKKFMKKLDGCISKNFYKIILKEKKEYIDVELYSKMSKLKYKTDPHSKKELAKTKQTVGEAAVERFKIVKNKVDSLKENESLNQN